ncbi:MAG: hypothetical protein IJH12_07180 [Clostridia bacterium]|nr:hypothetical protein [Clostridia bacterium]
MMRNKGKIFKLVAVTLIIAILSTIITIPSYAATTIVPVISGYSSSYTYTGSSIQPEITVSAEVGGETVTLVEEKDYTITYGNNTNVSEGGSITIKPVSSSKYTFNEKTEHFTIEPKDINSGKYPMLPYSVYYTGSPLEPDVELAVDLGATKLTKGVDYDVEFTNNDGQAGELIYVKFIGKGNYTGTVDKVGGEDLTIKIVSKTNNSREYNIQDKVVKYSTSTSNMTFSDTSLEVESSNPDVVSVTKLAESELGSSEMHSGFKMTVNDVGTAIISVKFPETDYYPEESFYFNFTVTPIPLTLSGNIKISDKEYDGTKKAKVTGSFQISGFKGGEGDGYYKEGTDYNFLAEFEDANVGNNKKVTVKINPISEEMKRRYYGEEYITTGNIIPSSITPSSDLADANITLNPSTYEYDGTEKKPSVSVELNDTELTEGTDYEVTYSNNVNAGSAVATIEGIGNYTGTVTKEYTITAKNVTPTIADIAAETYNGEKKEPTLTVTADTTTLREETDYTVSYDNNINAGTATATIKPVDGSNYTFSPVSKDFTINKSKLKQSDVSVSLEYDTTVYDGTEKRPKVTVKVFNKEVDSSKYTVAYTDNTDIGIATVTIEVKSDENSEGVSVPKTFEITDKQVLTIGGINDNQRITYTGSKVNIGTPTVSPANSGVKASDLTLKWYGSDGTTEIVQPTDVGTYYAEYSYENNTYKGYLKVSFEITQAESGNPIESSQSLSGNEGDKLSTITLSTRGLEWNNPDEELKGGSNRYSATYTKNGDTKNYKTANISLTVYGKKLVDVNTSVDGMGGTISDSQKKVREGEVVTITFHPDEYYEIDYVTVDGEKVSVENNKLNVLTRNSDMNVVVKYKLIQYKITITGDNVDSDGIIYVDYNSGTDVTIKPKVGYRLVSVKVNDVEMLEKLKDGVLSLADITADTSIVVTAEKIVYEYTYGAKQVYTIGESSTATFILNADYSLLKDVYVDGDLVDKSNYTSQSGSTVINFTKEYMSSLSTREHTLKVTFTDGAESETTFTVASANSDSGKSDNGNGGNSNGGSNSEEGSNKSTVSKAISNFSAKTGDNVLIYIAILAIALAVIIKINSKRKKVTRKASKKK